MKFHHLGLLIALSSVTAFAKAEAQSSDRQPANTVISVPESAAPRSALRTSDEERPVSEEASLGWTGDWGGVRRRLSDRGLDLELIGKYDVGRDFSGGQRVGSFSLWNFDVRASVDTAKMGGWKGGSFFFYFLVNQGDDASAFAGDTQVTDNIEASNNVSRLYEAWYQQQFFDDKVSILAGLHDLNSEFYVTETSALFFNASFGIGHDLAQTGLTGPSIFPVTAPCLRVRVEPSPNFYLQTAAFSGVAGDPNHSQGTFVRWGPDEGSLLISEAAVLSRSSAAPEEITAKYAVGTWTYSKASDTISASEKGTNAGAYFLADQAISETASVFFRAGTASAEINAADSNLSAGFAWRGLAGLRPHDVVGLGVTTIHAGQNYREAQVAAGTPIESNETTTELTYRSELLPGLVIQPDLQYVDRPGFSKEISHAIVGTIRFEIVF